MNIVVLVVIFFVGMFAGYSVLTKFFGPDVAGTLSSGIDLAPEDLLVRCEGIREQVCGPAGLGRVDGIGISGLAIANLSVNSSG